MTQYATKAVPATDGGGAAWRFLFGSWLIEAVYWSLPLMFGVFQTYYTQNPLFQGNRSIPVIGATAVGVSNLGMPIATAISLRYTQHVRSLALLGSLISIFSLVLAGLATKIWQLIVTQGILYGSGWVLCYTPIMLMTNGWWIRRRGLAYGIVLGATGISGLALPFVLVALLDNYGFRATLWIYAATAACITGPAFLWIKPRGEIVDAKRGVQPQYEFLRNKVFYGHAVSIFLQGLAYFVPLSFLPAFADSLGMSSNKGALLLTVSGLAQATGHITMGHISDKVDVHIPLSISPLITGLAVLFVWGPAKHFFQILVFSAIYGFFAGSYSVMWSRVCLDLANNPSEEIALMAFWSFERGIGNILSGPIAAALLGSDESSTQYALGKYRKVVLFTGITFLLSSLGGVGYFLKRKNRDEGKESLGYYANSESTARDISSDAEQTIVELEPLQKLSLSEDSD